MRSNVDIHLKLSQGSLLEKRTHNPSKHWEMSNNEYVETSYTTLLCLLLHQQTRSKFLVEMLFGFNLSISYKTRYCCDSIIFHGMAVVNRIEIQEQKGIIKTCQNFAVFSYCGRKPRISQSACIILPI